MMFEAFSSKDIEAMEKVENSKSSSFEDLVKAASLDPLSDLKFCSLKGVDLRGSDLSGFDLTGCDIEGAMISPSTRLPSKERMTDLKGSWIKVRDRQSIVELMIAIESSNQVLRGNLLKSLIEDYDSDEHIDIFLVNSVMKSRSSDVSLEFFLCMSPNFVLEHQEIIRREVKRILLNDEKRANPRRKVGAKDKYSFVSRLIEWLADTDIDEAADAAIEYRSGSLSLGRLIDAL